MPKDIITKFNKLLFLSLILVVCSLGINLKVNAEEKVLPFGQVQEGFLTKDITSNSYVVQVPSSGRVTFDLTSYVDQTTYISLQDQNNEEVFRKYVNGSSKNPAKHLESVDLEPGDYRLNIYDGVSWEIHTGSYLIKANFIPANNNDKEPNNGTVEAQKLGFGTNVTGFLAWNDLIDMYKITVPSSGRVTFDMSSYVDSTTYISLLDQNNSEVFKTYVNGSSKNPAKYINSVDLEPGIYYLSIYDGVSWEIHSGKYVIKTNFVASNAKDIEPNNGTVEAQTLDFYQGVTGFLSWSDELDVYQFTLPKTGRIIIDLTSYVDSSTYIKLFNGNNEEVFREYLNTSSKSPGKYQKTVDLEAGTYYLQVYDGVSWESHTGKYLLKVSAPFLLPTLSVNQVADNTTVLKGKTAANLEVVLKVSGKEYKGKADANGAFTISIPKQKAGTKISISVTNKYGTKAITTTVIDKTPPAVPSVNTITTKTKTITGKAEANSIVYVYSGSKYIGKAKADTNGQYKININLQKKGAALKIYAKDMSGNKSSGKILKVQ